MCTSRGKFRRQNVLSTRCVFGMRFKQAPVPALFVRHGVCIEKVAGTRAKASLRRYPLDNLMETTMQWTTPSYTDMRFGFEITMYIATR
jgi:pyrroloquinoline quinone biosynthesis protein A